MSEETTVLRRTPIRARHVHCRLGMTSSVPTSARMRPGAHGSEKRTVPSATALAPTDTMSTTSSPEATPPMPRIGTSTASAHAWTHASAMGLSAGPEYPPAPRASFGRHDALSTARPRIVLISERPSAPASATARADSAMSHVAGESFAYSGLPVAARAAATSCAAVSGASSTFGQDRFSSMVTTSSCPSSRSHMCAKSAAEKPPTETQMGTPSAASRGRFCSRNRSMPGFWRPIELSIPASDLRDARWRVSFASERRDRLRHERVEASGDVRRGQRVKATGCIEKRSHAASRSTGPSMHSRT